MRFFCLLLLLAQAGSRPDVAARDIADAEARRVRALVNADYAALEQLLGDDLTYGHSTGTVDTKTSYLQPLLSGRTRYVALEPNDVRVRPYDGTGVVTGLVRSTAMVAGRESKVVIRFTAVWVKRDGRWQMVAWQSTKLPDM